MKLKHARLKLYLDENFPAPAGMFLKKQRHNVSFTSKAKKGCSDEVQIKIATKLSRILVSLDKDFKVNEQLKGLIGKSPSIILLSCSQTDSDNIIKIINKQCRQLARKKLRARYVEFRLINFL